MVAGQEGEVPRSRCSDAPLLHDSNDNFLVLFLPFALAGCKLHLKHRTGSTLGKKQKVTSLYFELYLVPRLRQSEQTPFALLPIRELLNRYSQVSISLGLHNLPFLCILFNNNFFREMFAAFYSSLTVLSLSHLVIVSGYLLLTSETFEMEMNLFVTNLNRITSYSNTRKPKTTFCQVIHMRITLWKKDLALL